MASASASELRSQLMRAVENGVIDRRTFKRLDALVDEVRAMLYSLARTIRRKHGKRLHDVLPEDEPGDQ
jgi:four helix bundle protein